MFKNVLFEDPNNYKDNIFNLSLLIKFLKPQHLDDFKKGILYMNPYSHFRATEETIARGDKLEGVEASYRAEDITLSITDSEGLLIPIGGLTGRGTFTNNYEENINIFSMTGFELDNIQDQVQQFNLDNRFEQLGEKAVIIKNPSKFFSQIEKAFNKRNNIIQIPYEPFYIRPIEYVPSQHNGRIGAFRKLEEYSWQKEWRIGIYRKAKILKSEPYKFCIGSIEDLCWVHDTDELIKKGLTVDPIGVS